LSPATIIIIIVFVVVVVVVVIIIVVVVLMIMMILILLLFFYDDVAVAIATMAYLTPPSTQPSNATLCILLTKGACGRHKSFVRMLF
jgi:hypothetical protein